MLLCPCATLRSSSAQHPCASNVLSRCCCQLGATLEISSMRLLPKRRIKKHEHAFHLTLAGWPSTIKGNQSSSVAAHHKQPTSRPILPFFCYIRLLQSESNWLALLSHWKTRCTKHKKCIERLMYVLNHWNVICWRPARSHWIVVPGNQRSGQMQV